MGNHGKSQRKNGYLEVPHGTPHFKKPIWNGLPKNRIDSSEMVAKKGDFSLGSTWVQLGSIGLWVMAELYCGVYIYTTIYIYIYIYININKYITSSTAQGGGGSFKNRKPIGEVRCCEAGMAERIH